VQASAWREMSYTGPARLLARLSRIAKAACARSEFGNGNGGVHGAQLGWVVEGGWSCAHFRVARNFTWVAARVGNTSHLTH